MEVSTPVAPTHELRWATDKYVELSEFILDHGVDSVLDVGCRNGVLRRVIEEQARGREVPSYFGMDLGPHEEFQVSSVCDLSAGLPMADGSVDMAVALDVVEHLDDFLGGLEELHRVSRRYVAVTLPNLAHGLMRARFLFKGRIGGKYDLAYGYGKDRHRWLTVLRQTDQFLADFARERGLTLSSVRLPLSGPRTGPVERALSVLRFDPTWYVWVTLYVLEKPQ
jgi:SAM-dependent methyltransferase